MPLVSALPLALVYVSTSGVYGDCAGDWVAESRPVAPATPRALRRVNAERALRHLGRAGLRLSILRVPGIYAPDRAGGTPEARLRRGTPVLAAPDDVYTNHIHADDLAKAACAALAACNSWGRKSLPFSYFSPTTSSAGMRASSTSVRGSFSPSRVWVRAEASPLRPFSTACISAAKGPL